MALEEERSPDKRPSSSGFYIEDRGEDVIALLPLAQMEGVLVLRGGASEEWHGVSIFFKDEIQFYGEIDIRGEKSAAQLQLRRTEPELSDSGPDARTSGD